MQFHHPLELQPYLAYNCILDIILKKKEKVIEYQKIFEEILIQLGIPCKAKSFCQGSEKGRRMDSFFLGKDATLSVFFSENHEFIIISTDLFIFLEKEIAKQIASQYEEILAYKFGWENIFSSLQFPSGYTKKSVMKNYPTLSLWKYINFIYREKTQFQEARIYDTTKTGRILLLDDYPQITGTERDNYTVDITRASISNDKELDKVLIIGGGDLRIA